MKKLNYSIFIILFSSCIEKYVPKISNTDASKYVVSGQVTNHEGYQTISVSRTSPIDAPRFIPVTDCKVDIIDDLGNTFALDEFSDGKYRTWMDKSFLNPGTSYKVNIVTPEGIIIASDYDMMPECPRLDSVYYFLEDPPVTYSNPNFTETQGFQFYLDFTGKNTDSRFLRWELEETWEFHSAAILHQIIDANGLHILEKPDSSRFVCWKTETRKEIFTLSTNNLTRNIYQKFPIHYVDNHSQRLKYGYSLLVKQLALSEDAFIYWENLKKNSEDQGGLYERQPLPIIGNMQNISNPDEVVLGFFGASSIESKRIFISNVEGLIIEYNSLCNLEPPDRFPLPDSSPSPIYISIIDNTRYTMTRGCWDCISRGGKVTKPDFWPN